MNAEEAARDPLGHVMDAMDAISDARATLELLFYAGEGMRAEGIVRGATDAQSRLDAAQALLREVSGAWVEGAA